LATWKKVVAKSTVCYNGAAKSREGRHLSAAALVCFRIFSNWLIGIYLMGSNSLVRAATLSLMLATAANLVFPTASQAERVGYAFTGNFIPFSPTSTQNYRLFGVPFPNTSPLTGTFSFDTTAVGVEAFAGAKTFQQSIQGGFNFNVLNATTLVPVLRLSANDYKITVANDYKPSNAPVTSDYLSVDFNGFLVPTPDPNAANGTSISGATAFLTAAMSWDADTFQNGDELHADLPLAPLYPFTGTARTHSPAAFNITSLSRINPSAGDYNLDGKVDASDYAEWRRAFGGTSEGSMYADGNGDGVVDSCDFILWRDRQGGLNTSGVPEPGPVALAAIVLLTLAVYKRERSSCGQKALA
jgi:hypothetical protein